jgi:NAD(P)-dependent dehydrogenase (short-subunit alcohol dehydrogenase family)
VFATPASGADAHGGDAVDLERGRQVWVAGRDVAGFGQGRSVTIDGVTDAFPTSLATLRPVYGPVAMMKAVLPGMRQRRRGHIVNVTSRGGFITMPGISFHCGSKFALEGISEALGKEVVDFGIRVTSLAPGQFRTDWAGRSMERTPRIIGDYDDVIDPIRAAREAKSGHQPDDPARAAQALLTLIDAETPPARLFIGDDALQLVDKKIDAMREEIAIWAPLSRSTAFPS